MYSPFCSFSWEGFCFLYPFFSRIEISHQPNLGWRPAIQRPEPEDIGFYVCVASPLPPIPVPRKRVPWSPLYPKESGPLSFHSRRPSLFCRFCLISAQACLPSGASQRAKKKTRKESFLARGSFRRGWKGDFSLSFLAWEKGSISLDQNGWRNCFWLLFGEEFSSSVLVPKFAQVCLPSLSQIKFPQNTTEQNTFPSVLLSFVLFPILFRRLAEKFSAKIYEGQWISHAIQSISKFH